jgi:hypothetical protein
VDELVPALFGGVGVHAKPAELGPGRGAARPKLEAAVGDDVEDRGAFGDPDRVVELGDADHDAVPDPDALGLHRARRQENLGCGAMGILFEKMVLHRPHVVKPELVGEANLLEGVLVDLVLGLGRPGPRHGQLVEDPELHSSSPRVFALWTRIIQRRRARPAAPGRS